MLEAYIVLTTPYGKDSIILVLSRKTGQSITIGNTTVTISQVKGDRVKIAIQAPEGVKVLRSELPPLERKSA